MTDEAKNGKVDKTFKVDNIEGKWCVVGCESDHCYSEHESETDAAAACLKKKAEPIKESMALTTPTFFGTTDEKLEALTLWTGLVASLKKVSELPTFENKVSMLSCLISEANQTMARVTNVGTSFAPLVVQPPAPPMSMSMSQESQELTQESQQVSIRNRLFGTDERMARLSGIRD